ncbi:alpha/beta hydrolase [Ornithinimicrobium sp. Y1694]|uniref:alpha/beta hydrolase n=1 Tax=Ornithinimicrobium sp. Y1694 TaxID=3418590 RepID=UPI003CF74841
MEPTPSGGTSAAAHVILVPGFWLGAWAWDEVRAHLRERGVDSVALTLPGLEPDHPDRGSVRLEDHVRAIEDAMTAAPEGSPVALVAHSGAAVPATIALDRQVGTVGHVIWVDTAPAVDGYSMNAAVEGDEYPLSAQWDEEFEGGSMRDLTQDQLATFQKRAVPQPAGSLRDAATLTDEQRLEVPMTLIATAFPAADYVSYAKEGAGFLAGLLDYRRLELVDLPTGHWPMWSKPAELAEVITTIATSNTPTDDARQDG